MSSKALSSSTAVLGVQSKYQPCHPERLVFHPSLSVDNGIAVTPLNHCQDFDGEWQRRRKHRVRQTAENHTPVLSMSASFQSRRAFGSTFAKTYVHPSILLMKSRSFPNGLSIADYSRARYEGETISMSPMLDVLCTERTIYSTSDHYSSPCAGPNTVT